MQSTSTTPIPTPAESISRPSSRGAFELHVQSVRAARGLEHLVSTPTGASAPTTHVIPPPSYVALSKQTIPSDEKSRSETDSDFGSIVVGDVKSSESSSNNRLTNDDGPEPKTLARALFLYGFFFPLFWCLGASILFLDLAYHQTPDELAEDPRTLEERKADLKVLRRAEVRWAWRSIYALVALIVSIASILLIWAGATGRFTGIH